MHEWRTITVRPPWSWAIRPGGKNIENRAASACGWDPTGPVAIIAARTWSMRGGQDQRLRAMLDVPGLDRQPERMLTKHWAGKNAPEEFHPGYAITIAWLADIHHGTDCALPGCDPWGEHSYVNADGTVQDHVAHLVLEDIALLPEPVTAHGHLGLRRATSRVADVLSLAAVDLDWPGLHR